MFPDSTLRGNAELGDNNQVAVELVIYLFWLGKIIGGKMLGGTKSSVY